jgi:hypothetical protein
MTEASVSESSTVESTAAKTTKRKKIKPQPRNKSNKRQKMRTSTNNTLGFEAKPFPLTDHKDALEWMALAVKQHQEELMVLYKLDVRPRWVGS